MVNNNRRIQEVLMLFCDRLPNPDAKIPFDVKAAQKYIHDHLLEPLCSVNRMKKQCNIQTNNFSTRFSFYIGMPPKRYITYYRIEAAKRLLSDDELKHISISRIGFAVGYEKPSSFSTIFKNKVGVSPSAWRRKILKNRRKI